MAPTPPTPDRTAEQALTPPAQSTGPHLAPHLEQEPDLEPEHQHGRQSTGPIARIVAGSVGTGLAAATLLVAVVFPGATEATITGSLLVGFGFGWALLGWATARFTQHPLRWTRVPACGMAATGIALIVFTPQDGAPCRR